VIPGGARKEVGNSVDHQKSPHWTFVQGEAEQRDDAVDIDEKQRAAGVCRQFLD
jgi:hypothetical protein